LVSSVIELRRLHLALGLAHFRAKVVDGGANLLDFRMPELDRIEHGVFFHFFGARLDHHDTVGSTDNHDVDQTLAHLVIRGIHHELPVDQADANRAQRTKERNVGNRQGARRAVDAQHVRIVIGIGRKHEGNNLRLALESLGKHGTHRPINLPASEHFTLAHATLTLDEASGKSSAGIGVLAIIHSKREKIDAFAWVGIGGGRGEHNVFAEADNSGPVGLLGELSGFK
jgi:hypothetical protein